VLTVWPVREGWPRRRAGIFKDTPPAPRPIPPSRKEPSLGKPARVKRRGKLQLASQRLFVEHGYQIPEMQRNPSIQGSPSSADPGMVRTLRSLNHWHEHLAIRLAGRFPCFSLRFFMLIYKTPWLYASWAEQRGRFDVLEV